MKTGQTGDGTPAIRVLIVDDKIKSREVRLGLVLYGGVSLAIYINGVAFEFFRAVQGNGAYRLIKALTDSDIVVDVVSGTSAGGINGIALAQALCGRRDFAALSSLWRLQGDINQLLHDPGERRDALKSLLRSDRYQTEIGNGLRSMPAYFADDDDDPSDFSELDLYVTGTNVDGRNEQYKDAANQTIPVKDHREVFWLKHRRGRKEPFDPAKGEPKTIDALAKLACITSAFPAAFEPVTVGSHPRPGSVDALLEEWGSLETEQSIYFLDGGVLDNKPFSYALQAIYSRHAERDVERKLFFVDPDPPTATDVVAGTVVPNFAQSVFASVVSIPRYESISDDLKEIDKRNDKLDHYNRLLKRIARIAEDDQEFRQARIPLPNLVKDDEKPTASPPLSLYERSRLLFLCDRVILGRDDLAMRRDRDKIAALLDAADILCPDQATATELFRHYDVYYRMRRLYRVVYEIFGRLRDPQAPPETDVASNYRTLWRNFNRRIERYEILSAKMEKQVNAAPIDWSAPPTDNWPKILDAIRPLLDITSHPLLTDLVPADRNSSPADNPLTDAQLSTFRAALDAIAAATPDSMDHQEPVWTSLLERFDGEEAEIVHELLPNDDPVRQAYNTFEHVDELLFPLEVASDIHEKDQIALIRISPADARHGFNTPDPAMKVAGDALHHFGGFFKRSWRSNDILWGRLDGLAQLTETLLTSDRLELIVESDSWREVVRSRFFEQDGRFVAALDPSRLFPTAGGKTQDVLRHWLRELFDDDAERRQNALAGFDHMLGVLVEAAQLEIIREELPRVLQDDYEEGILWNNGHLPEILQPGMQHSTPRPGESNDETIHSCATLAEEAPVLPGSGSLHAGMLATSRARQFVDCLARLSGNEVSSPTKTPLGEYFLRTYQVGSEELLRDVPTLVLLELLAKSLLVTRSMLLGLSSSVAKRVESHPLYKALNVGLWFFYRFVQFARRSPGWARGAVVAASAFAVLVLTAGIIWFDPIVWNRTNGFSAIRFGIFIALPVLLLIAVMVYVIRIRPSFSRSKQRERDIVDASPDSAVLSGRA